LIFINETTHNSYCFDSLLNGDIVCYEYDEVHSFYGSYMLIDQSVSIKDEFQNVVYMNRP